MSNVVDAAIRVRDHAYARYSGYKVGAAIRSERDEVWTGCNVENISYPLSICAERNAVGAMVSGGWTRIEEVAVATRDGGTPCGGCLQVLLEFCLDPNKVPVHCVDEAGTTTTYMLSELIPHGFRSSGVSRTER